MLKDPVFKSIFSSQWELLPVVMKKRYANKPYSQDIITIEGKMDFIIAPWAKWLMPLLKWLNILVPYAGENIDATVHFKSEQKNAICQFERWIKFPGKKPYHFLSKMINTQGNEVIEQFKCGICWRMKYHFDGEKILLLHQGYCFKILGKFIPLPISAIVGQGYAEEVALDDNRFKMRMTLTHPLFGVYYEYNGIFTVSEMQI